MGSVPDYSRILNSINANLEVVNSNVGEASARIAHVSGQVEMVAREQADTKQQLDGLYKEFQEFIAKNERQTALQLASTNIIEVKQQLEKNFGHYDVVRRHTTGILQATDLAIVREGTMLSSTEELVLSCPGYWLAPALVALTSWIVDNRDVAGRALAEAIKRDDSKASLFFALVCRRARRRDASASWLLRYFQNQDPTALDSEVVEMLNALANGVFGGEAMTKCSEVIDEWLGELEQRAGFPEEQRKRWADALSVMTPRVAPNEYPTLRTYSPTWPRLEATLASARRNQVVGYYFQQLFTGEIIVSQTLEVAVDGILDSLVTKHDKVELPIRREEQRLQLIIDEGGDIARAQRRLSIESESLRAQNNFAALLTNAAMYPEKSGATPATQRYAVSRCREWIKAGFNDLTAWSRAQVPAEAELVCGSWKGASRGGSNEQQLSGDLGAHYASRIEQAVNAVSISGGTIAAFVIGALLGFFIMINGGGAIIVGLLIMAGAGALLYFQHQNLDNLRQRAREELEKERDEAGKILKAGLAELADFRRETAKEDAKAEEVLTLLSALSSPQFVLNRPGQARAVVV